MSLNWCGLNADSFKTLSIEIGNIFVWELCLQCTPGGTWAHAIPCHGDKHETMIHDLTSPTTQRVTWEIHAEGYFRYTCRGLLEKYMQSATWEIHAEGNLRNTCRGLLEKYMQKATWEIHAECYLRNTCRRQLEKYMQRATWENTCSATLTLEITPGSQNNLAEVILQNCVKVTSEGNNRLKGVAQW